MTRAPRRVTSHPAAVTRVTRRRGGYLAGCDGSVTRARGRSVRRGPARSDKLPRRGRRCRPVAQRETGAILDLQPAAWQHACRRRWRCRLRHSGAVFSADARVLTL